MTDANAPSDDAGATSTQASAPVDPPAIRVSEADLAFAREVAAQPGGEHIMRCFACGTCTAGCPMSEAAPEYSPRKIIRQVLFGQREEVLSSPLLWYCQVCYRCTARCPQQVNFTDIMRVLRYLAVKGRHVTPEIMHLVGRIDRLVNGLRRDVVRAVARQGEQAVLAFEGKLGAEGGGAT